MRSNLENLLFLLLFSWVNTASAQQGIAYPPNPHASWYFLTPSSFGPPKGKAILQSGMLAAWQYQKTTPGGNTYTIGMIPTLLLGKTTMPLWVSGHRRIPIGGNARKPWAVANIGGFFLSVPKSPEQNTGADFSLFYGNLCFGTREKNLSIGAGFAPTGLQQENHPQAITLHGMIRLGPRSCLITENYLLHNRGNWTPISMSGWRGWRKKSALDLSILLTRIPANEQTGQARRWLPLPWIAFHKTLRFDPFNHGDD